MCVNGAVFEAIAHDWRTASIAPTHSSVARRKRDLGDLVFVMRNCTRQYSALGGGTAVLLMEG